MPKRHFAKCWCTAFKTNGQRGMSVDTARKMLSKGLYWLRRGPYGLTRLEKAELLQDVLGTEKPVFIKELTIEQCRLAIVRLIARGWLDTKRAWVNHRS